MELIQLYYGIMNSHWFARYIDIVFYFFLSIYIDNKDFSEEILARPRLFCMNGTFFYKYRSQKNI